MILSLDREEGVIPGPESSGPSRSGGLPGRVREFGTETMRVDGVVARSKKARLFLSECWNQISVMADSISFTGL